MYQYRPTSWKDQLYFVFLILAIIFVVPLMLIYALGVVAYLEAVDFYRRVVGKA